MNGRHQAAREARVREALPHPTKQSQRPRQVWWRLVTRGRGDLRL